MDQSATTASALAIIGVLIFYLVRARKNRPVDKYREALRELSGSEEGSEPIDPAGDPHETFDRVVDGVSRGFNILNLFLSVLIVGLVVYFAVVDPITRIVVFVVLAIMGIIWLVGKRMGRAW
jgi:hypothetical protein